MIHADLILHKNTISKHDSYRVCLQINTRILQRWGFYFERYNVHVSIGNLVEEMKVRCKIIFKLD
jgi:hypothetical protein